MRSLQDRAKQGVTPELHAEFETVNMNMQAARGLTTALSNSHKFLLEGDFVAFTGLGSEAVAAVWRRQHYNAQGEVIEFLAVTLRLFEYIVYSPQGGDGAGVTVMGLWDRRAPKLVNRTDESLRRGVLQRLAPHDEIFFEMRYRDGSDCGSGLKRSTLVTLRCGNETSLKGFRDNGE
jgi:hypothetical protein